MRRDRTSSQFYFYKNVAKVRLWALKKEDCQKNIKIQNSKQRISTKNVAKVSLWALNQSSGVMRRGNIRFSILKKPKITFIMLINPSTFIWP